MAGKYSFITTTVLIWVYYTKLSSAVGDGVEGVCEIAGELELPVVDISRLTKAHFSLEDVEFVQSSVEQACFDYGIFELKGHGLSDGLVNDAFKAHAELFALSKTVKSSIPIKSGGFTRGYVGLGMESGSDHLLECKEAFSYGMEWSPDPLLSNKLQGENIWPSESDYSVVHKQALLQWYNESIRISELMAIGIAPTIGLDLKAIKESIQGGETISIMRLFRYISEDNKECVEGGSEGKKARIGSSPHTDWGFLTLILGDGGEGLQIFHKDAWYELKESSRTKPVIICGDYLSLMSGSKTAAPVHRVVLPKQGHRSSFVLFYYPNFNANFGEMAKKVSTSRHQAALSEDDLKKGFENPQQQTHNTMLDLALRDPSSLDIPFGEYIMRKWNGVFKEG